MPNIFRILSPEIVQIDSFLAALFKKAQGGVFQTQCL